MVTTRRCQQHLLNPFKSSHQQTMCDNPITVSVYTFLNSTISPEMTRTHVKLTTVDRVPDTVGHDFVSTCREAFNEYSNRNPTHMRKYFCKDVVIEILKRTNAIVSKENTLLEVR